MRLLIVFILLLGGCTGKSQEKCDSYDNAKTQLVNYSNTSDQTFLKKAQLSLDSALKCPNKKQLAVIKKIQIFTILETYEDGIRFLDTLNTGDFEYPYQKSMYSKYFKSKEYMLENNMNDRDSIIKESIQEIQYFIDKQGYRNIKSGLPVYSNLFFMKSRIYDSIRLNRDIDSLKIKYKNENSTIEDLRKIAIQSIDQ